jgi:hypothetical protein
MSSKFRNAIATTKKPEGHHCFEAIRAGRFWLSVQGHKYAYCSPRENRDSLTDYYEVELAITSEDGKDGWVQPLDLPGFPAAALERWEPGDVAVAAYVPMSVAEQVYDFLCSLGGAE